MGFISRHYKVILAVLMACFLLATLPLTFTRPTGGDRIGQTAGIVRIYCQEPGRSFLKGPHIHFGHNPFNLELTVFEWIEGAIARAVDGPECDSVEPVAKVISMVFGALALLGAAVVASSFFTAATAVAGSGVKPCSSECYSPAAALAGIIAAVLLGTDSLWLRYSTYTMIEHRTIAMGLFAIFFSLRRNPVLACLFWALTILQKPQSFSFLASFWAVAELVIFVRSRQKLVSYLWTRPNRNTVLAVIVATGVGYAYFKWSCTLNEASDLPWVQWMGPRSQKWFIGNWGDRFRFAFYKNLSLDWLKRSGLNVALPLVVIAGGILKDRRDSARGVLLLSLPLLGALFAYLFVFYAVFVVHEYYALPLNVGTAISTGMMLAYVISRFSWNPHLPKSLRHLTSVAALAVVMIPAQKGVRSFYDFGVNIDNPSSPSYLADWNVQVFPKKNSFVVVAVPSSGRDVYSLYLTKQRGFAWCNINPKFAPRAFWKTQGVEYVAWAQGQDPKTGRTVWQVNTIDEELKQARTKGWSSDSGDAWAGKTMAEWAALGSRTGKDPCIHAAEYDPRSW